MSGAPFIPFSRPDIQEGDIQAVAEVIRSGWWTTGPVAREFESEFAAYARARHAVSLNSCTAALHVALEAVGVSDRDVVVTTTNTFAATGEVILYRDAVPVLVDIDFSTMNLDAAQLAACAEVVSHHDDTAEALRTAVSEGRLAPGTARVLSATSGRIKAVIPVHFAGQACEMDSIIATAQSMGAAVVEDAAHAVETTYGQRKVGSIGDVTAFSFYATKNLSTGEGGMATTDSDELAERMRRLSLHGISRDAWNRYTQHGSWYYEIVEQGYKYNLTDVAAALGRSQFARIEELSVRRREIVKRYMEGLADVPGIVLPADSGRGVHAWHLFVLRLDPERTAIDRGAFIEALRESGIGTSVHFIPLHLHPLYRERFGYEPGDFPVAEASYANSVSLPLYPSMSDSEVGRVVEAVRTVCEAHRR